MNYGSIYSLDNWYDRLDLHCREDVIIAFFGSMDYAGQAVGALIAAPLSDRFGRKPVNFACVYILTIIFSCYLLTTNYIIYYILLFLQSVVAMVAAIASYVHLMEFFHRHKYLVSSIFLTLEGFIMIESPLIMLFVTRNT